MIEIIIILILIVIKIIESNIDEIENKNNKKELVEKFVQVVNPDNVYATIDSVNLPSTYNFENINDYISETTSIIKKKLIEELDIFFEWIILFSTPTDKIPNVKEKKVRIFQECNAKDTVSYDLGIGKYLLNNLSPKIDKIGTIEIPYGLKINIYESCSFDSNKNQINEQSNNSVEITESTKCFNDENTSGKITFKISTLKIDIIDQINKEIIDKKNIKKYYFSIFSKDGGFFEKYLDELYNDKKSKIRFYNTKVYQNIDQINNQVNQNICNTISSFDNAKNALLNSLNQKSNYEAIERNKQTQYRGNSNNWIWSWEMNRNDWRQYSCNGWPVNHNYAGQKWRTWRNYSSYYAHCYSMSDNYNNAVNSINNLNVNTIPQNKREISRLVDTINNYESQKKTYPDFIKFPNLNEFKNIETDNFLREYASLHQTDGKKRATIIKKILLNADAEYKGDKKENAYKVDYLNDNLQLLY